MKVADHHGAEVHIPEAVAGPFEADVFSARTSKAAAMNARSSVRGSVGDGSPPRRAQAASSTASNSFLMARPFSEHLCGGGVAVVTGSTGSVGVARRCRMVGSAPASGNVRPCFGPAFRSWRPDVR